MSRPHLFNLFLEDLETDSNLDDVSMVKYLKYADSDSTLLYVVLGPRKSAMPLVRDFSENDKIFRREKKYVE